MELKKKRKPYHSNCSLYNIDLVTYFDKGERRYEKEEVRGRREKNLCKP